jgi:hypothetical protein
VDSLVTYHAYNIERLLNFGRKALFNEAGYITINVLSLFAQFDTTEAVQLLLSAMTEKFAVPLRNRA